MGEGDGAGTPWRGIDCYEESDADAFFGRDRVVRAVDRLLRDGGFAVVVGPSGSGKSSVLRAGLSHAGWKVHTIAASAATLDEIHAAIQPGKATGRLVVVDRFEAIFRECSADERASLLDAVVAAVEHGGPPIACALRSDAYGDCASHREFAALVSSHHLLLGPPDEDDLREMVEAPAALAGIKVDADVVDAVVDDVLGEAAALPLLSFALAATYGVSDGQRLRYGDYRAAGGAQGAIALWAENLYADLSPSEADAARDLVCSLADPSSVHLDVGRRVRRDTLAPAGDTVREAALHRLLDARILTSDAGWVTVSHEAILREWPRARAWVAEDRRQIQAVGVLVEQAALWDGEGRPTGSLLRGGRLDAALDARSRRPEGISGLCAAYVDESEALRASEDEDLDRRRQRDRRRTRVLRTAVAALGISLTIVIVAGLVAWSQREDARATRRSAQVDALIARSRNELPTQRDVAALLALEADRISGGSPAARSAMFAAFTSEPGALGSKRVPEAFRSVNGLMLPDGRVVVANDGYGIQVGDLDALDFGEIVQPQVPGVVLGEELTVSADGSHLALVTEQFDGTSVVSVLDVEAMRWVGPPIELPYQSVNTALDPAGSLLAVSGGPDGSTVLYSVADLSVAGEVPGLARPDDSFTYYTAASAFTAEGDLVVGSEAPVLRVVDPKTFAVVDEIEVPAFSFNRDVVVDGALVLGTGSVDIGNVTLVDRTRGEVRWALTLDDLGVTGCASPALDGPRALLYCGDYYGRIVQRDLVTGAPTGVTHQSQIGRLGRIQLDPTGTTLVGYGTDRPEIVRWRVDGTGPITRRIASGLSLDSYNADGSMATAVDYSDPEGPPDGDAAIIDTATGDVVDPLDGWRQPRWQDDPSSLLVARELESGEWQIRRYRIGSGPADDAFEIRLPTQPVATILGGGLVATSTPEGQWSFWDDETGASLGDPLQLDPGLTGLVVTGDGDRLVTFGRAGAAIVDRLTGKVLVGPRPAPTFGVVTGPDELIGTDPSGALTAYDLGSLDVLRKVSDTAGFVQDLRADVDGATLLTKGGDRSVELFDLASGVRAGTALRLPEGEDSFAHLRPDGAEMALGGGTDAGTALWSLDPDLWREELCVLAGRNLTPEEWERYLAWSGPYHATCPLLPSAGDEALVDDGVWIATAVPIDDLGVDAATAELLRGAGSSVVSVELLVRGGRYRLRTADGVAVTLGSGTVTSAPRSLSFLPGGNGGPDRSTVVVTDRRPATLVLGDVEDGSATEGVSAIEGMTLRRR